MLNSSVVAPKLEPTSEQGGGGQAIRPPVDSGQISPFPGHVLRLQPAAARPQPALLLDRDGAIIEDRQHLCDPAQVVLCAGAQQLIQAAAADGWPVVVVTNQSGIARCLFSWEQYEPASARTLELLGPAAPTASRSASADTLQPRPGAGGHGDVQRIVHKRVFSPSIP